VCGYGQNQFQFTGTQPGAGFFYGNSPTAPQNGTATVPKPYLYPFAPLNGSLPFQAYLQVQVKI